MVEHAEVRDISHNGREVIRAISLILVYLGSLFLVEYYIGLEFFMAMIGTGSREAIGLELTLALIIPLIIAGVMTRGKSSHLGGAFAPRRPIVARKDILNSIVDDTAPEPMVDKSESV